MFVRRPLAVTICAILTLPALAQEKAKLQWKFESDKTFYQKMTTKTVQTMNVMGQDVSQKQEQTLYFSYTPKEVDKDGNWTIAQKIEGFKTTIDINNQLLSFDSTAPSEALNSPGTSKLFLRLVGTEFKLTVDKSMKVTKVDGMDAFVKKLSASNQQMENLLKKYLSDDSIQQMADQTFGMLPGKDVTKGEKWTKETNLGGYANKYTFTYEGKDDKDPNLHILKVESSIQHTGLTAKNSGGTMRFNAAKGRLEDSDLHLQLDGSLDVELAGTATKVELSQRTNTTIKCSDTK